MSDYREALKAREVIPNSTWMRKDNSEMWVILPDDDASVVELMKDFAVSSMFDNDPERKSSDGPGWIRVARIRLDNRSHAGVDIVFIPMFLGQIDKGIFTRIG